MVNLPGFSGSESAYAFSADNRWLALATNDNLIHIRSIASGIEQMTLNSAGHAIGALFFSPDGRTLYGCSFASGRSRTPDNNLLIWPVSSNAAPQVVPVGSAISDLALSANGKLLALVTAQDLRLWDTSNRKWRIVNSGSYQMAALSPDGKYVAALQAVSSPSSDIGFDPNARVELRQVSDDK